ncbi:MAG: VOC family protein [Nocardioidaceae bacterium]|nr:VOC family protein [Nocardioidaceae bacterium]MCL2614462.1 VOC family protein [Nocardioidaceae bacterium]
MTDRPAVHLAIPVDDLRAAREFYGDLLGLPEGRSSDHWVDWDFHGHQLVTHLVPGPVPPAGDSEVDGHDVPIPHFGLLLTDALFHELAGRLRDGGVELEIAPYLRFPGEPGEQWTMFFHDPAGNAIELKSFRDESQVFAR